MNDGVFKSFLTNKHPHSQPSARPSPPRAPKKNTILPIKCPKNVKIESNINRSNRTASFSFYFLLLFSRSIRAVLGSFISCPCPNHVIFARTTTSLIAFPPCPPHGCVVRVVTDQPCRRASGERRSRCSGGAFAGSHIGGGQRQRRNPYRRRYRPHRPPPPLPPPPAPAPARSTKPARRPRRRLAAEDGRGRRWRRGRQIGRRGRELHLDAGGRWLRRRRRRLARSSSHVAPPHHRSTMPAVIFRGGGRHPPPDPFRLRRRLQRRAAEATTRAAK